MFYAILPKRAVISLSGEDSIEFLQGLISNDARLLADGNSIYAALLSPQGKFLHDFFLIPWQGKIFIDVQADRAGDLLARLKMYRLRSKVEIALGESLCVVAVWGGDLQITENENHKIYADPRCQQLGFRAVGAKNSISDFCKQHGCEEKDEGAYEYFRLSLGVPDTGDMIIDRSLLLECGFEQLHGVDFSKGCYVGQEVTARSKFRGQVRKAFYRVSSADALTESGTKIMLGEKIAGEMRSSFGNIGMAMIYNDIYEEAQTSNMPFLCNGEKIEVSPVKWN